MTNKHFNAVIIGAGAGGGIVAKELTTAGLSVLLLERGKWYTYDDTYNDDLASQRTFPLYCGYGPDNKNYRRVFRNEKGEWKTVLPNNWDYGNNAACVGGGTLSYGAMGWRFMPEDFHLKSIFGDVRELILVIGQSHTTIWNLSTKKQNMKLAFRAMIQICFQNHHERINFQCQGLYITKKELFWKLQHTGLD